LQRLDIQILEIIHHGGRRRIRHAHSMPNRFHVYNRFLPISLHRHHSFHGSAWRAPIDALKEHGELRRGE
jgi:hypothetical protein